ncbi:MAG: hypothetical protein D6702_11750 [Planctomycetota bacterium]|nr:MAG: hypothetical protein D6702_11750 [Planctomycetota bacterium]
MILPVVLLFVGFALVAAEVFFPSAGVLSILAGCTLIASIITGFGHSLVLGWVLLGVTVVGLPLVVVSAFRVFPRTPMGRRMIQGGATWDKGERAAVAHEAERFVGRAGTAASDLRPSGIARFDGERVDVITRGEHIAAGTPVRALRFEANRLLVEALPADAAGASPESAEPST